jgi:hypothetical protein
MPSSSSLVVPFALRGLLGQIDVTVGVNTDPAALGYSLLTGGGPTDFARGFPFCEAKVAYPGEGYRAVFGWTQMVSSTDSNDGRFEMDPIAIYEGVETPFAWYGVKPVLFDAPSRESHGDMVWRAHSFLCVSPDAVITRRVQAVAGFSWGFDLAAGHIEPAPIVRLDGTAWDAVLGLLRQSYPSWAFDAWGTAVAQ